MTDMKQQQGPTVEHEGNISKHQKEILDYAAVAVNAANRAQTEELTTRTEHIIRREIHQQFELFTKMTTTRKVMLGVGIGLAFGAGFLTKGWLSPRQEPMPSPADNN